MQETSTTNGREIPFWEKWTLSINEASEYFGIGQQRIRKLIDENSIPDCILYIGSHVRIKRIKFEQFLDEIDTI